MHPHAQSGKLHSNPLRELHPSPKDKYLCMLQFHELIMPCRGRCTMMELAQQHFFGPNIFQPDRVSNGQFHLHDSFLYIAR